MLCLPLIFLVQPNMHEASDLLLRSVSVVILADVHNPSILNPNFLKQEGIVTEEWKISETVTTPPFSFITYDNGIRLTVDPQKFIIIEKCNFNIQEKYTGHIHKIARRYVEKLPHVSYYSLGLNCAVSFMHKDPKQWITKRFLKSNFKSGLYMTPKFSMEFDGHVLNLEIISGSMSNNQNAAHDSIRIRCNIHHDISNSVMLCDHMKRWNDIQKKITDVLYEIVGSEKDVI